MSDPDEWFATVSRAWQQLAVDLVHGNFVAARAGVWEAQQDHPYTDRTQNLTNTAHPQYNVNEKGHAAMVWPMEYASYVDGGTSRNKAYPFVPTATRAAKEELRQQVNGALERFAAAFR